MRPGGGPLLVGLLVAVIGAVAVYRYIELAREHPEARQGFEILLGLSIAVIIVFMIGLLAILRSGARPPRGEPQG